MISKHDDLKRIILMMKLLRKNNISFYKRVNERIHIIKSPLAGLMTTKSLQKNLKPKRKFNNEYFY